MGRRDLMRWWENCWTCREFGQLAPTLLRQLLTLYEELWAVHERLYKRIGVQSGARTSVWTRQGVSWFAIAFGRRPVGERPPVDACARYVAALSGGRKPTWVRESLCDDGEERAAAWRRAVSRCGRTMRLHKPLRL